MHRSIQTDFLLGFRVHHNAEKEEKTVTPARKNWLRKKDIRHLCEKRRIPYRAHFHRLLIREMHAPFSTERRTRVQLTTLSDNPAFSLILDSSGKQGPCHACLAPKCSCPPAFLASNPRRST
jgi:hypothetical protein